MKWDYEHNLLNVSASLHRWYGLPSEYEGNRSVDAWLNQHHFRTIIALLIDGMGTEILKPKLKENSFFRTFLSDSVSTVYPPTTTAATTSFLTGKSPRENGWLGWNQYFAEEDDQIILFRHHSEYGTAEYPDDFAERHLPIRKIYDELNANGIKADSVWPSWAPHNPSKDYEDLLNNLLQKASGFEMRFLYGYWDELDSYMHAYGPSSPGTKEMLNDLDAATRAFAEKLPEDTGLLIIADHGQIAVQSYDMMNDAELCSFFRKAPSLEARTVAFFIREEKKAAFPEFFHERFGDQFILKPSSDPEAQAMFGPGRPSEHFEAFLGDYLAFAVTPLQLCYGKGTDLRGNHAGMMHDEAAVPVILYPEVFE